MKKLHESLKEFNDDGSKFQLATPSEKTWKAVWNKQLTIGKTEVVFIEAGYTSTVKNSHTAVINVTVKPLKLDNGAEDQAAETITVFYKDFVEIEQAIKALEEFKSGSGIKESEIYTQVAAPTIGLNA